jgi:hypothetical protein
MVQATITPKSRHSHPTEARLARHAGQKAAAAERPAPGAKWIMVEPESGEFVGEAGEYRPKAGGQVESFAGAKPSRQAR